MKATTLESKFPLLAVEGGCIISKDADITVVYRVELPELFTAVSYTHLMKEKTEFVAFSTQKGGAGKTTLTVLAASYLHYVKLSLIHISNILDELSRYSKCYEAVLELLFKSDSIMQNLSLIHI